MAKLVIAITGPCRGAFWPRFLVATAVRWYGAKPIQLKPGDIRTSYQYDGVVITGGHDVEPVLYAAESEVDSNYDSERDAFEMDVIKDAIKRHLPLLGICRGAQLLNVCFGGSLFQELRTKRQKTSNRWTILPLKTLCVADEERTQRSLLSKLFEGNLIKINSLHNQGVDRVGEGLIVSGRDLDGIVQAIESPKDNFLLGVQWHPEFLIYLKNQRLLFKALVQYSAKAKQ